MSECVKRVSVRHLLREWLPSEQPTLPLIPGCFLPKASGTQHCWVCPHPTSCSHVPQPQQPALSPSSRAACSLCQPGPRERLLAKTRGKPQAAHSTAQEVQ